MYRVYKYTFPNNLVYIGVTQKTIAQRKAGGYRHNKYLENEIKRVGWEKIQIDILAEFEDEKTAFNEEKRQIALHSSTDRKNGYNITPGGKGNHNGPRKTIY